MLFDVSGYYVMSLSKPLRVSRDAQFAATTEQIFSVGPQVYVDIDVPSNNPFRLLDRYMSDGTLREGAVKVRLYSTSKRPLPIPFDEFSSGDFLKPLGKAVDQYGLVQKYVEVGVVPLERDGVYMRWRRVVKGTDNPMTLRSIVRRWQDKNFMTYNPYIPPDQALTKAFRQLRGCTAVAGQGTPYLSDWSFSLFHMNHVNFEMDLEWQHDHHFGVSLVH
jgi:hypothetical protein